MDKPFRKPRRLQIILILGSLSAFGPLSTDMYLPSLPSLSRDFNAGASLVQLTLSTCFLGLAIGQIVAGPISDALGRRRPLLFGLATYALSSLLCVVAPSIYLLILLRFIQGFAGAVGIVIARATVRDLYSGIDVARFFSLLMLVSSSAPILAPLLGGLVLTFTIWRGVFIVLTLSGAFLFLAVAAGLGETLPPDSRQSGGFHATIMTFYRLLTTRSFVGYALSCALGTAAMFAYISGSSFVLQDIYGLSPQLFSVIFGTNALGLMLVGQVNGRLVGRVEPIRLLAIGLTTCALGGIVLLLVIVSGSIGLPGVLLSLFVIVSGLGFVMPNAITLALSGKPNTAGSASALVGVLQFSIGSVAAPLVGTLGTKTALPMALTIAVLDIAALVVFIMLSRDSRVQPDAARESTLQTKS